jgi:uncharacterized protein YggE
MNKAASGIGLFFLCSSLLIADDPTGISVIGTGRVNVMPDQMEITLLPGGTAELSSDAIVKYRDALQSVTESFGALKMEQLSIRPEQLMVQQAGGAANARMAAMMGNDQAQTGKSEFHVARSLRLVLAGIGKLDEAQLTDAISKLLDTARDSGVTVNPGNSKSAMMMEMMGRQLPANFVTFVVTDSDQIREEAYQHAFRQARQRAARLAALAEVTLGEVVSVEEMTSPTSGKNTSNQEALISAMYGLTDQNEDEHRVTSNQFGEIPIVVTLKVRFALASGTP